MVSHWVHALNDWASESGCVANICFKTSTYETYSNILLTVFRKLVCHETLDVVDTSR